jgi:hypothetical protein
MDAGANGWGDPDLEGIYTNKDETSIPFERPKEFAGRRLESITAAELGALIESAAARPRVSRRQSTAGVRAVPPQLDEHSFDNSPRVAGGRFRRTA